MVRHVILKFYVDMWYKDLNFLSQDKNSELELELNRRLKPYGIKNKRIPPKNSKLRNNLKFVLNYINENYTKIPDVRNILLYLSKVENDIPNSEILPNNKEIPDNDSFCVVHINYTKGRKGDGDFVILKNGNGRL